MAVLVISTNIMLMVRVSITHGISCTQQVQSFVGSNYFCESGVCIVGNDLLYPQDPLWDAQECGTNETICCSAPGLPWFHRDYGNVTTTDYIELRACAW